MVDEPTVQARNMLRSYERDFARMKATSDRPSMWEQIKIGRLTPDVDVTSGGLFENEASAQAKLKQQQEQALLDMNDHLAKANDVRLTDKQRQDALQKAIEEEQFIKNYFGGFDTPNIAPPSGGGVQDFMGLVDKVKNSVSPQGGGFKYLGVE
jgi:hypothetical protein